MTTLPTRSATQDRPALRLLPAGCERRLWGAASGLRCTREAGHAGAHVYLDPYGSDVADRHRDGGHG
jgi:hypothetical protein